MSDKIVQHPRCDIVRGGSPRSANYLTARIVGRRIPRLLGNAVVKLPTGRNVAQQWSLKP